MRPLTHLLAVMLAATLVAAPLTATPVATAGEPPAAPDHGIDPGTFWTLWSGDVDTDTGTTRDAAGLRALAAVADVPLAAPPPAVAQWNRGDHGEFPATNRSQSVAPPFARLVDGRFIADAHATTFAIQPATAAHYAPGTTPLLVRPTGTVLGVVDYRITHPPNRTTASRRVRWSVRNHAIREVRLLVDGRVVATAAGSHTPALRYAGLAAGSRHELTLAATISTRLRKRVARCEVVATNGTCASWNRSSSLVTATLTVADTREVRGYTLSVDGTLARFPDGRVGIAVTAPTAWRALSWRGGDLRTRWRFYSARDRRWDTLQIRSAAGMAAIESPLRPLVVHAYPGPTRLTATGVSATVHSRRGPRRTAPTLPGRVTLDTATGPYRTTRRLVATLATAGSPDAVRLRGLVSGSSRSLHARLRERPVHRVTVILRVRDRTATSVTVVVRLRDATAGTPLSTAAVRGQLTVNGQSVTTNGSGAAVVTIPRRRSGVQASFTPGPWWRGDDVAYTSASAAVYPGATVPDLAQVMYTALLAALPLLIGVYLLDRMTPGGGWLPWRRR